MSWLELLLIPLGFAVGVYGTLVGAGGGFVLVPALLLLFPAEEPVSITSISLAVVFFTAVSATGAFARLRRIDFVTGGIFAGAAIPGALAGAMLVNLVPRQLFDLLFALVLLSLAAYLIFRAGGTIGIRPTLRGRFIVSREMAGETGELFRYSYHAGTGVAYSGGVGFFATLFGVGGGIINVPVMITLLRIPMHIAVATSQFILMFTAGTGSAVHLANGDLTGENLLRAALLTVGAIPAAQVGARLAQRFRGPALVRLLALALVAIGARLLYAGIMG